MWLTPVVGLGAFSGVVLAAPAPSTDLPVALLSYGGVGILALVGLVTMRVLLRSWERERAELIAGRTQERERAERAEQAFTDLNAVVQRDVLGALRESQRTVGDALAEIRRHRG